MDEASARRDEGIPPYDGLVWFLSCRLDGHVWFLSCCLDGHAWFPSRRLDGHVWFPFCRLDGHVWFLSCCLDGLVWFPSRRLDGHVWFPSCRLYCRMTRSPISKQSWHSLRFSEGEREGGPHLTQKRSPLAFHRYSLSYPRAAPVPRQRPSGRLAAATDWPTRRLLSSGMCN